MNSLLFDPIVWTAAGIAFLHTILGPDHYLPFIALGKSRGWTLTRTLWTTAVCGLGHVGSSLLLAAGVAAGSWSLASVTGWEGFRGDLAAWLLLGLGAAYAIWGFKRLSRRAATGHTHEHAHADGTVHVHGHGHDQQHVHPHVQTASKKSAPGSRSAWIGWSLFVIFVLGPCEPLVPLLMVPASQRDLVQIAAVAIVFVVVTLVTMLAVVVAAMHGLDGLKRRTIDWRLGRYGHVAAGSTLACCGLAMLLGL